MASRHDTTALNSKLNSFANLVGRANNTMAESNSTDENFSSEAKCRWSSYGNYRLIIWVWMMNETTVMFSPTEISHNGYYFHAFVQTLAVIFIGIPLVYSEICLAQYTNCDVLTMWNFFPLFRYVGFGYIFLIVLKTIYLMVLTSWYLEYSFFAALDPPPWSTCDHFNDTKCMVKRVNVSIFQHCLEAYLLFNDDCGMKTASNCFFEREIGTNNTKSTRQCFFPWKAIIASTAISLILFVLSIRKEKFIQIVVKLLAVYVSIVILILFCVALSTSGTWYATSFTLHWSNVTLDNCYNSITRGVLSLDTGSGIILFLSRDVPFRSPATMTAISTSLFSLFTTLMLALIAFSGIKTMSFFHGEEENVIEIGSSIYFLTFASMSEIMTYFEEMSLWGFCWFSAISFCLFVNLWILHLYLGDILFEFKFARKYKNCSYAILIFFISLITWPFFCSDLTVALTNSTELIQLMNNILFSVSFFWIYGYHNHNIDIMFMIGIKASYFWKLTWLLNPILLISMLYFKWRDLHVRTYDDSYIIDFLSFRIDWLLLYIILGIYFGIVIVGILTQLFIYYRRGAIVYVFFPTDYWGPRDIILFKSRKLFVPEIMTTEFLYRQVRIYGYHGQKKNANRRKKRRSTVESLEEDIEWSALTSN